MNPLPVFRTVLLAAAAIQLSWRPLLVALVIPAACILIVDTATAEMSTKGFAYAFLAWAISAPFYALFAVVVHRTVILGRNSLPNRIGMFWSERETRFIGWTLAIFLLWLFIAFLIGAVSSLLAQIGSTNVIAAVASSSLPLIVWLALVYLYTRLSVLFPATAVDDATSFERAWLLTEDNGFRMIGVWILTVGPFLAVSLAVSYGMPPSAFTTVSEVLLGFVVMFVGVCAVSVTYRQLVLIEREQFGGPRSEGPGDSPENPSSNPFDD